MNGLQNVDEYPGDDDLNRQLAGLLPGLTAWDIRSRIAAALASGAGPRSVIEPLLGRISTAMPEAAAGETAVTRLAETVLSLWNDLAAEHNSRILH